MDLIQYSDDHRSAKIYFCFVDQTVMCIVLYQVVTYMYTEIIRKKSSLSKVDNGGFSEVLFPDFFIGNCHFSVPSLL